jgi:hypothetical protein
MYKVNEWLDNNIDTMFPDDDMKNKRIHKEELLNAADLMM